jgi:hypothetical protein
MASPKSGYYIDGERVPGTTTIIGRFGESEGLKYWAWQMGHKQAKDGKPFKYMELADKPAETGTLAHRMIELHINGEDPYSCLEGVEKTMAEKATNAYKMYEIWESQTGLKMLSKYQEIQLVSKQYRFGGCPDAIGEIHGKIVLLDWKSSAKIYPDYLLQLAAYKHLVNEGVRADTGEPLGLTVTDVHLCRFAKDYPDFEHRYFGDVSLEWEQFKAFRECWDRNYELGKRIK